VFGHLSVSVARIAFQECSFAAFGACGKYRVQSDQSARFGIHPAGTPFTTLWDRVALNVDVVVPVCGGSETLGATRRQRQNGVESVERLNRRLFIDREDGGVTRSYRK
jgi:hypothetical protein